MDFFRVRCAISTIGAGGIGAPLVLADYKEDESVRSAYYLGFTNRKRKYFEEKTTATLKSKQTSIATVRNHLRTLDSFPTSLIFHWSLLLSKRMTKSFIFGSTWIKPFVVMYYLPFLPYLTISKKRWKTPLFYIFM
jgi:hypothetical protein